MEPVPVPHLTITLSIELDVEYNPFNGKTEEEYAKSLEEELPLPRYRNGKIARTTAGPKARRKARKK